MKVLILLTFFSLGYSLFSQEVEFKEEEKKVPTHLKYFKEKYEYLAKPPAGKEFDYISEVKKAVLEVIQDVGCQVLKDKDLKDEQGLSKSFITTDVCVFVDDPKTAPDKLDLYSKDMPIIRGATWSNGRVNYKIILKENEDNSVSITITGEISGAETFVTNQVHFWTSNGYLESKFINSIKGKLGFPTEEMPWPIED